MERGEIGRVGGRRGRERRWGGRGRERGRIGEIKRGIGRERGGGKMG
jgi:hypothetical protein